MFQSAGIPPPTRWSRRSCSCRLPHAPEERAGTRQDDVRRARQAPALQLDGALVAEPQTDQAIAEVETAKSVVELPSPFAGVVTALHGEAGDVLQVGAPVLEVADAAPPADSQPAETTEKIELMVGRDLQYIRLNGTIVGALAGLVIHAVSQLVL